VTLSIISYLNILYPHMGPPTTLGPKAPHHLNPALGRVPDLQQSYIDNRGNETAFWCSSGGVNKQQQSETGNILCFCLDDFSQMKEISVMSPGIN